MKSNKYKIEFTILDEYELLNEYPADIKDLISELLTDNNLKLEGEISINTEEIVTEDKDDEDEDEDDDE